ncbi:hypothetical protein U1P98_22950 [Lysinibacillus irui]|uniref:DUF1657 domain-containing protein n=1 Tax=Lysinibacillus irui TaxID=2998077 RepID=A0ABU5NSX7_9BACI|nr:hypothetical protein [Lysinibacillus irui]MEA0556441.1 hypothetical protein [Lysinibacillus irui]MEA0979141.1 hypothetical protein [Lysinibacillus irui]MEA1045295.1 hypothetical protein [Lysinibacillus irui]
MAKTDKELAVELTIAVVKAKADIITSIQDNNSAKQTQLATTLSDAVTTATFNQIYQAINSK